MVENESPGGLRSDIDTVISEMHRRLHEMVAGAGRAGQQMMPAIRGEMPVDLRELEDEVVVVADLPGLKSSDVTVRLLSPGTLRITARREGAAEEAREGYVIRERMFGELSRTVNLHADVTDEGASATFKNGVLAVRLKKIPEAQGIEIAVSEEGEQAGTAQARSAEEAAAEHREMVEEQYREDREKVEPSGYMSSEELEREAKQIELEEKGSPEEVAKAAELRKQKEQEYEEAKKKLGGQ